MESVLDDLKAIQHFVHCIKDLERDFRAQDAHTLLLDNPIVKTYLRSQWKLSELSGFFRKYNRYFKLDIDDTVTLRNQSLTVEELKSVYFFVNLLIMRQNRPFHISATVNFINVSGVNNFLINNYDVLNLTPFFEKHRTFFFVQSDFISLKNYTATGGNAAATTEVASENTSRKGKRYLKKMDKAAVNFYVDLLKDRLWVDTKQAHSFLQEEYELRDFLRENYQLCNLGPFFDQHPDVFTVNDHFVYLRISGAIPSVHSTPASVPNHKTAATTTAPVVTQNTKPEEAKLSLSKQQDLSFQSNSKITTPKASSTPINNPQTGAVPKKVNNVHGNVSGSTNITNLLSLVMSYSPQVSEPRINSNPVISKQSTSQDAACQTLSTGPILSLSVVDEVKRD